MSWLYRSNRLIPRPCNKHINQINAVTSKSRVRCMSTSSSTNISNNSSHQSSSSHQQHSESNKSRYAGYIVFLSLAGVAVSLGVWQINRRKWKIDLINKRQSALEAQPVDWSSFIAKYGPKLDAAHEFQKVRLAVHFDYDHEFFVGPRGIPMQDASNPNTALSQQGFLVITPALVEGSNQVILVNRGWVDKNCKKAPKESNPTGYVDIVGLTRMSDTRPKVLSLFPDDSNNQGNKYLFVDVEGMQKALNLSDSLPLNLIDIISPSSSAELVRPPLSSYINFSVTPIRHAAYATSWFGIATAITLGTLLRFKRPTSAKTSAALIGVIASSDDTTRPRR